VRSEPGASSSAATPADAAGERRILVVANETVGGHALRSTILAKSLDTREEVLVVTPALNSPLRHWASDEDPAREEARQRLEASLRRLRENGIQASGEVGGGDPAPADQGRGPVSRRSGRAGRARCPPRPARR